MKKNILALSLFILGQAAPLPAEVMTYQGRLKESNIPVSANRSFDFELCATETPTGCVPSVDGAKPFQVLNGLFKSTFTLPAVDFSAGPWYLRVKVEGVYLSPVERLTFVPYSVFASSSAYAGSASALGAVSGLGVVSSTHVIVLGGLNASDSGVQLSTVAVIEGYALLKNLNTGIEDVRVGVSGRVNSDSTDAVDILAGGNFEVEVPINRNGSMIGVRSAVRNSGSSALAVGLLVDSLSNSGTIGDTYGVWIATLTQGAQTNKPFALYSEDPNARSYFAGNVGISSRAPAYALSVSSAAGDLFWVADDGAHGAKFWGDGSGLTGVTGASGTDSTKLLKSGDTMTGQLTLAGSTLTVTGDAFSVGGSTFVVANGNVGVGTASPVSKLQVAGGITADLIASQGAVSAAYYQVNGSTVLALLPGIGSMAVGPMAGAVSAGAYNLFVGSAAGKVNSSGIHNVLVGYGAGAANVSGTGNTFIGSSAGSLNTTGLQNIVIGYNQQTSASNSASELNIGGVIFGQLGAKAIGISTRTPQAALDVVSSATGNGYFTQIWRDNGGVVLGSMSATGSMQAVRFVGDGSGITGLGSAAAAGTATNLAGGLGGYIPYQAALNTTAMVIAGISGEVFQSGGTGAPSWTNSPTISGVNITGVTAASLSAGSLPGNVIASSVAIGSLHEGAFQDPKVNRAGDMMYGSLDIQGARLKIIADTAANQYSFAAGTGTAANQLYVSTGGNVGIGLETPGAKLTLPYNGYLGWDANNNGDGYVVHSIGKATTGATSLQFRNNGNPGPAGRQFSFLSQGVEILTLLDNGNVGVSTIAPVNKLAVLGGILATSSITAQGGFFGDGSGLANLPGDSTKLPLIGGTITGQLTNTSSVTITGNDGGVNGYGLQVSSNVSLAGALYTANGKVGIGTANPNLFNAGTKLMISGTSNPSFDMNSTDGTGFGIHMYEAGTIIGDITANSGNMYFDSQNGSAVHLRADPDYLGTSNLYLETGKVQRLTILAGGNVGIGTVSPAEKLDVAGVIRSTNTIYPGDGLAFQSSRGISDDALNYRTVFSSNVYMVGYSSAAKYYGDGSGLTGLGSAAAAGTATNLAGGALGEIPYQSGASATAMLGAGVSGQLLQSGGAAAPSWTTPASGNTASAIVKRDASGNFSAGMITANVTGALTGNADTVTNGAYTTAAYADPAWITSLATSKINLSTVTARLDTYGLFLTTATTAIDAKLLRAGDTMTGQLTNTSSVTITGNGGGAYGLEVSSNISLAGALYSANGNVGIGVPSPLRALQVGSAGTWATTSGILLKGSNPGIELADTQGTPQRWLIANGVTSGNDGSMGLALDINTGQHRVVVLPVSGNVGIGTTAPDQKLTVAGNISQTGVLISSGTGNNYFAGNVGIGTPGPVYKLHVFDTAPIPLYIQSSDVSGSGLYLGATAGLGRSYSLMSTASGSGAGGGKFALYDANAAAYRFVVDNLGNVGIGTTGPGAKLDVAGVIRSTAAIYPGDGLAFQSSRGLYDDPAEYRTVFSSNVYMVGYSSASKYYGDGSGLTGVSGTDNNKLPLAGGTMSGDLTMGGKNIYSASTITATGDITAARYQINGSTVLAVLPGASLGVGLGSGRLNQAANNIFIGNLAGYNNTTGFMNSFLGHEAGYTNAGGANNTFVGWEAGYYTTAGFNSFLGSQAGYTNTSGSNNSFFGAYSGLFNSTGKYNTLFGFQASQFNSVGSSNTIMGYNAGNGTTSNSYSANTLMGYQAGFLLATGSNNVLLGFQAGDSITGGSNNIIIGYNKDASVPAANDELNIGGLLYGDLSAKTIGISTRAPQAALDIVSTGTVQTQFAQIWRDSNGNIQSSMSATGVMMAYKFVGDGSGLAGVAGTDSTKLPLGGGMLTGQLSVFASTGAFSYDIATNGIVISTGGAVQTVGTGYGTVMGNSRGNAAVDLQASRTAASQVASGLYSVIGGGLNNTSGADSSVVAGGNLNSVTGSWSTVSGGKNNTVSSQYSMVPGGVNNTASGNFSFAAGYGAQSTLQGDFTWADSFGTTVTNAVADQVMFKSKGGFWVSTSAVYASPGLFVDANNNVGIRTLTPGAALDVVSDGGTKVQIWRNPAGAEVASVGSYGSAVFGNSMLITQYGALQSIGVGKGAVGVGVVRDDTAVDLQIYRESTGQVAYGYGAVISGGHSNTASGNRTVVSGGYGNASTAESAVISGGWWNKASGMYAVIGGGVYNEVSSGMYATLGGGRSNAVTGSSATISGGAGNYAVGDYSAIPGGGSNTAKGKYAFAAGYKSSSTADGTFTWADSQGMDLDNNIIDQVRFKARGGFWVSTSTAYGSPGLFVDANNNVGIGTVSPGVKLHVSGGETIFEGDVSITTSSAGGGSHLRSSQPTLPGFTASNPGCGTTPSGSVNGTDMAGTVTLNAGTAPSGTCVVTVNFVRGYALAPKAVLITPMGPNAHILNASINPVPTISNFVIQANAAVSPSTSYSWSYIVIE